MTGAIEELAAVPARTCARSAKWPDCSFSFAGMPYEYARQSMKLLAEQVVPVVRDWEAPGYQAA